MTLAADFNTISDRIGVTILLVALALLILGDLRPARWSAAWVQLSAFFTAVAVIAVRFVVMI